MLSITGNFPSPKKISFLRYLLKNQSNKDFFKTINHNAVEYTIEWALSHPTSENFNEYWLTGK